MCEVSALIEVHTHQSVAGLQNREFDRQVGLRARVGLNVCVLTAEELLGSLDRECLDLIDHIASAVITFSGVSFSIFIGQRTSHRGHNSFAGPVLGSDQLDMVVLSLNLFFNGSRDFRICHSNFIDRIHLTPPV